MKLQIDLKTVFISIVKFKTLHFSGKLKVGLKSPHKSQTPSTKLFISESRSKSPVWICSSKYIGKTLHGLYNSAWVCGITQAKDLK